MHKHSFFGRFSLLSFLGTVVAAFVAAVDYILRVTAASFAFLWQMPSLRDVSSSRLAFDGPTIDLRHEAGVSRTSAARNI